MLIFFAVKSELFLNFAFSEAGYILMFLFFQKSEPLINMVLTKTSCSKASNGQRFSCPALLLSLNEIVLVFLRGSRAAAPIRDKVLQNVTIFLLFVCLSICFPLWAIQPGLGPSLQGLRPSMPGLKPEAWLAGPEACLAEPEAWLAGPQAQLDDSDG